MTFYQELQLSSAGSKQLIKKSEDRKEKLKHILIYNFKVYLVVAFCFLFVTIFSLILGPDNSVVGVVVLLAILVLRQVDLGISTSGSMLSISLIFLILAFGPKVSNMVPLPIAFLINLGCIFMILMLCCHNVIMMNQATFVLGYLILQGYDVSGKAYLMRLAGLAIGMVLCMAVFYHTHRNRTFKRNFTALFREFDVLSTRTQMYIKLSLGVSLAMLLFSCFHLPRVMWVGIACSSLLLPFSQDVKKRAALRGPFNIIGSGFFLVLHSVLPAELIPYIGIIGGVGVGFSASYAWQTVFNTFGALEIASRTLGVGNAIFLRILANVFASVYAVAFDKVFYTVGSLFRSKATA